MPDYSRVKAVVFDAVGTVMYPQPSVAATYCQALQKYCRIDLDEVKVAEVVRMSLAERTTEAELLTSEQAEHEFWGNLIRKLCPNTDGYEACYTYLFEHFACAGNWRCFPDVEDTVLRLQRHGITVAIASNFDLRLNAVCDGMRELADVKTRVISSQAGYRKPAPEFFQAVVAAVGVSAEEILMAGDDLTNDVHGALAAGLNAVWVNRSPPDTVSTNGICRVQTLTEIAHGIAECDSKAGTEDD